MVVAVQGILLPPPQTLPLPSSLLFPLLLSCQQLFTLTSVQFEQRHAAVADIGLNSDYRIIVNWTTAVAAAAVAALSAAPV